MQELHSYIAFYVFEIKRTFDTGFPKLLERLGVSEKYSKLTVKEIDALNAYDYYIYIAMKGTEFEFVKRTGMLVIYDHPVKV